MASFEMIEATYRVTTPMFCGGADNARAELRLASFKGVLRFWWRALAWRRLAGNLDAIRSEEAQIFGSTDGQAKALLRLDASPPDPIEVGTVLKNEGKTVGPGARYLGYGVMHTFASRKKGTKAGQLTRECLPHGWTFHARVCFKPQTSKQQIASVRDALSAVGMFGGLGSKSRKGWGSISLVQLDGEDMFTTASDFGGRVRSLLYANRETPGALPAYTAASNETRCGVYLGPPGEKNALGLLDDFGREMIWFRSNGRVPRGSDDREVLGEAVEPKDRPFWQDHELMGPVARSGKKADRPPQRIAFGLPHNYFFSSTFDGAAVEPQTHDRRASAQFIHVHSFEDIGPTIVLAFLPARFLPDDEKIRVGNHAVDFVSGEVWKPVRRFWSHLGTPKTHGNFFSEIQRNN